jgi:hypothetical protein
MGRGVKRRWGAEAGAAGTSAVGAAGFVELTGGALAGGALAGCAGVASGKLAAASAAVQETSRAFIVESGSRRRRVEGEFTPKPRGTA